MNALPLHQTELSLADQLADLAVAALIDEAELSPKPALVDGAAAVPITTCTWG